MWGRLTQKWTGRNNPPRSWGTGWSESREVSLFHLCDTPCMQAEWTCRCCGRKCQCHCGSPALEALWMQQGECWALGKGVNGRKADSPLISSAEEEFLHGYCVLWLYWFWISITELGCCQIWEELQRFTVEYFVSQNGSRCSCGLLEQWPQLAVFQPVLFCELPLGSLKPATASIWRAPV